MFATPMAGQSIANGKGEAWLVHSVTRTLAATRVKLSPLRGEPAPAHLDDRFEISLSDFRIFCTFSGILFAQRAPAETLSDARD